jgi:hypothetical protein
MLPETKQLALEEMNMLFSEAPFFIGNRSTEIRERCAIGGATTLGAEKEVEVTETEKV